MIRVGILGHGFVEWSGGLDFLCTICSSLQACGAPIEQHLLLPLRGPRVLARAAIGRVRGAFHSIAGQVVAASHAPSRADIRQSMLDAAAPVAMHAIDRGTGALARAVHRLSLDVLLPAIEPLPFGPEKPWVGYIYDFQHRHLPHFFSEKERRQRDQGFIRMLNQAAAVIVNARAVAADAQAFCPDAPASVFALPFNAAPAGRWLSLDVERTRQRYSVADTYFIVCNQFWKHKDHATAFAAFTDVVRDHPMLELVCTGATSDYRDPQYFADLMDRAAALGIRDRVRVLGLVPKLDQIALLRGARALLQPTRFEGGPGGGAVYDAVSVGTESIVSDIAVNLEVDESSVRFFRAGDPQDLAKQMRELLRPGPAKTADRDALVRLGQERRKACGRTLLNAIEAAGYRSQ